MRILVETGTYDCSNLGDLAMLQTAVNRLATLWPSAVIEVFTEDAAALERHCPGTVPVPCEGRRLWMEERGLLGPLHSLMPGAVSRRLIAGRGWLRGKRPGILEWLIRAKVRFRRAETSSLRSFLTLLEDVDLMVVSGSGGMTDHSAFWDNSLLSTLEMARSRGTRIVMLGQGMGPLTDPARIARARNIFPYADLIGVREGLSGPALLESMGVAPERILVTGDEAVEMAYRLRPVREGGALGINLRAARSSGVSEEDLPAIRTVLHERARALGAPLIPLPIGLGRASKDVETIRELLKGYDDNSDGGAGFDTPEKMIRRVGECRMVVTGAYHAAVFALSQGIPAVCLAKSDYFKVKFEGLADRFGAGCEVLTVDRDLSGKLSDTITTMWNLAQCFRPTLLVAAIDQIEKSWGAYYQMRGIVDQFTHPLENLTAISRS